MLKNNKIKNIIVTTIPLTKYFFSFFLNIIDIVVIKIHPMIENISTSFVYEQSKHEEDMSFENLCIDIYVDKKNNTKTTQINIISHPL